MFLTRLLKPTITASAHCDLPCGVYDPEQARIEAESCYKIIEKYKASNDEQFKTRAILIKEERAELAKHHIDVLWSDYFKPEHVQKYPEILMLKRVAAVADGACTVLGDRPEESTDSRTFGPVPLGNVVGRALFRYAPIGRIGWLW